MKRFRPRGLGGLLRRLEWRLTDLSIGWRFRHAMADRPPLPEREARELVVVCDHLHPRHNVGRIIRTAEVFGAAEVHVVGTRVFNPATATTALHALPVRFFDRLADSFADLRARGYALVVLETVDAPTPEDVLQTASLPARAAFVVGNERDGVSFTRAEHPDARWITIEQRGLTRCLDVSSSLAIGLYEHSRQHGARPGPG